jgi:hypothetical protein
MIGCNHEGMAFYKRQSAAARSQPQQMKQITYRSKAWLAAVASLPCVLCGREGETQAAHRNQGKGMGLKTDDCLTAALCQGCHADIDQGKAWSRTERRERLDGAILMTLAELARRGLIGPK